MTVDVDAILVSLGVSVVGERYAPPMQFLEFEEHKQEDDEKEALHINMSVNVRIPVPQREASSSPLSSSLHMLRGETFSGPQHRSLCTTHRTANTENGSRGQPTKGIMKHTQSTTNSKSKSRSPLVKFNVLQVREYPQILGDNPFCSTGLPISLDWNHTSEYIVSVDAYESLKHQQRERESVHRTRRTMKLDEIQRREILLHQDENIANPACKGSGATTPGVNVPRYTEEELRKAERKMFRERDRSRRWKRKIVNQFFQPPVNVVD